MTKRKTKTKTPPTFGTKRITVPTNSTQWAPTDAPRTAVNPATVAAMSTMLHSMNWWVGDWLNSIPQAKVAEIINDDPRFEASVLSTIQLVALGVPPERRRASLPWEYHKEIWELPPDVGDAILDRAEKEGLTLGAVSLDVFRWKKATRAK